MGIEEQKASLLRYSRERLLSWRRAASVGAARARCGSARQGSRLTRPAESCRPAPVRRRNVTGHPSPACYIDSMKPTCCGGIPFEAADSQTRSPLTLSARQVDAMAAARKVVERPIGEKELAALRSISRSRTEPASHVARARMLLHYRDDPSCRAAGRTVGVTHQTVQRCLARASRLGVTAALDDSPRPWQGA